MVEKITNNKIYLNMNSTKTKEPTIQFIVDLKEPGDYEKEWTLIQTNPKVYISDSGEIFQGNKIIVDSDIRNTIKRGYPNPLENFYNVGDKVRIISKKYNIIGTIKDFELLSCGSQKDYIGLTLITEKPEDCLYRSDIFDEFTVNSILSEKREHLVYSGIMSISKIHD